MFAERRARRWRVAVWCSSLFSSWGWADGVLSLLRMSAPRKRSESMREGDSVPMLPEDGSPRKLRSMAWKLEKEISGVVIGA